MPRAPLLNFRSVPSPREIEWIRILGRWKASGLSGRAFSGPFEGAVPEGSHSRPEASRDVPGGRRPRRRGAGGGRRGSASCRGPGRSSGQ